MRFLLDRLFIKKPRLRRLVTRIIYGNRDVSVDLCGSPLIINTLTENGYFRASRFIQRSSLLADEIPVLLSLASLVGQSDGFVDIGANVGVFSSVMARIAKLHSKRYSIYAFEVDPNTFRRLSANADRNGFSAFNVGVAAEAATATFVRGAVSHVTTLSKKQNAYSIQGETFEARCAPLREFAIVGDSLIIKLDVEGQELSALEGCEYLLQAGRVLAVYVDGYDDQRVLTLLAKYGFDFRDGRTLEPSDGRHFSLLAVRCPRRESSSIAAPL